VSNWVQHISGQGEKWEVAEFEHNYPHLWRAKDHQQDKLGESCVWLPKSEYILCAPPKQWEDVTGSLTIEESYMGLGQLKYQDGTLVHNQDHRLRKIRVADCAAHGTPEYRYRDVFIIERRKP
jgi:hypothetical protein